MGEAEVEVVAPDGDAEVAPAHQGTLGGTYRVKRHIWVAEMVRENGEQIDNLSFYVDEVQKEGELAVQCTARMAWP